MKFLNVLLIALLGIVMLAGSSTASFARNEVVNGTFKHGEKISPIEGDKGVALWKMTRPDNGQFMYFEKCWKEGAGWLCKYEVFVDGKNQPPASQNGPVGAQVSESDTQSQDFTGWSGTFKVVKNADGSYTASKNGKPMGTFGICKDGDGHAGKGTYCKDDSFISN